ncbi:response regulator transcription factor [Bradyrhizobium icense]|uniref:HTH luxR-type domain-containing protein n=1 Tax=Bradyrhizobium icense TaxID=1274631 RepID=A0A1B1UEK4_9BRAD|nr:LuxR C-terminal-related transcriptional regulator [Bradyrhizobium icense]ANW01198.1 hypothetical protein LMTR13_14485 [Bradyrhizobium icense]
MGPRVDAKPINSDQLLDAIKRAMTQYNHTRAEAKLAEAVSVRLERLTDREREVFRLVIEGRTNREIASELGTTERTIKAHRQKVMEKMEAHSVPELVTIASRLEWRGGFDNPKAGAEQ